MKAPSAIVQALARRGLLLSWVCAAGALTGLPTGIVASGLPDAVAWLAGLASHWQWVYLVVGLAGASLALCGGRHSVLLPAVVVLVPWLSMLPGAAKAPASDRATSFVVASANLNFETLDFTRLTAWLTSAAAPDVIALQEFTDGARLAVMEPAVLAAYPHRVLEPSPDQFGLAVLSRNPIESLERVSSAGNPLSTLKLRVTIALAGTPVAVTVVHPMPPVGGAYARERDTSLRMEAVRLVATGVPGILVGDMNDTPWSTGLRGAAPLRRATGLAPTWPNAWGLASLLPLDHILVTLDVRVVESSRGPDLGSDHRPVVARLVVREP